MTEAEWLTSTDSQKMLESIQGTATERKMRLFLIACAHLVWDQFTDPVMRHAVEMAERYVEGLASIAEQQEAHGEVYFFARNFSDKAKRMGLSLDVYMALVGLSLSCGFTVVALRKIITTHSWKYGAQLTGQSQPVLLRDIFANPFRPVTVAPTSLPQKTVSLAQSIYDERVFDRLPILADALEEDGCDNSEILTHCRGPGPHVRGCWVLDLVLGKS
jgi:hypothetical protein